MTICLGLSAAFAASGASAVAIAAAVNERRENRDIKTSTRLHGRPRSLARSPSIKSMIPKSGYRFSEQIMLQQDGGGTVGPAVSWRRGGPRALAAFVKRPPAARSNRR